MWNSSRFTVFLCFALSFWVGNIVSAQNTKPVITSQNTIPSVPEEGTLTLLVSYLDFTDPDPDVFALEVSDGSNYSVSGTDITPDVNYTGPLAVQVAINDGTESSDLFNFQVNVDPINDPPTVSGQVLLTVGEDQNLNLDIGNFTVNDPDLGDTHTLTVLGGTNYTFSGNTITPLLNFYGELKVNVRIADTGGAFVDYETTVAVTPVNDAPIINGQSPLNTQEDFPITINFADLAVTDPDNTYPTGFSIIVLTGTNYSFLGSTITPTLNFFGTLNVNVRVSDGTDQSSTYILQIEVGSVNDPPIITGQNTITTPEDEAVTLLLSHLLVTDLDNTFPTGFTLSVIAGSNYTFLGNSVLPAQNYNGPLTVNVKVNDGSDDSPTFGAIVNVTPVNDPPEITGQLALSTPEEQSLTIPLSSLLVSDPDNTFPTGFSLSVATGANYTVSGTTITPATNFNGMLTVNVMVSDGSLSSPSYPLQVQVTPVNDPPVISSQTTALTVAEDQSIAIQLSNLTVVDPDDTYPTGFTLTVLAGTNYTFSGNMVTPLLNYNGPLTVNVSVNDGDSNSNTFGVSITVAPVNDPPLITGQSPVTTAEDQPMTILLSHLIVLDPDNMYPSGFTLAVLPGTNYTVSGNTITPNLNFNGTLSVNVRVNDGTNDSNIFGLAVNVTPVNDAAVITGQSTVSADEDLPFVVAFSNLVVNDPDNTYPTGFTLTVLAGTNYTFSGTTVTPALNYSGTITVNVRVNDGLVNSNTFGLVVQVNAVNDPPIIISQSPLSVNEEQPITILLSHLNVTDPDNSYPGGFSLSVSSGSNYSVSGNIVTPSLDFNGILSVPVTVSDGTNSSQPYNVQITVNPVNDAPQIIGQTPISVAESEPVTLNLGHLTVFDPDNNYPSGFTLLVLSGANYTLSGSTVTPAANFSGVLQVGVLVNDGTAISAIYYLQISVDSVNDPPVITGQTSISVNEDQPFTVQLSNLTVSDPDNSYPADFTLQVLAGTNYTYSGNTVTPATNFNGTLTVKVSVNDGLANSAPFNLQVQVNPVNDAPTITGQVSLTTNEDQAITLKLSDLVVNDPDNAYPTGFNMTILSGSNYTFSGLNVTPSPNFSGTLTVPVMVNDGLANSPALSLSISVSPVNDAPVITGQSALATSEDQPITIQFANLIVTDIDNTYPTGFSIIVQPGANYTSSGSTVTPSLNFNGPLSVSVVVNDGSINSSPFNITIQVNSVNDPPTIAGQKSLSVNEEQTLNIALSDLTVLDPDNTYPTGFTLSVLAGSNYTISGTSITPVLNFNGILSVVVRVNDGSANSAPYNLQVQVAPVNDPPVITAQVPLATMEDTPITLTLSNFTVNDPDNTYPGGFSLNVLPGTNYTVSGAKVTPKLDFVGNLTVGVTVNDGTDNSAVFNVLIQVTPENDPPTSKGFPPLVVTEDDVNTFSVNLANVFTDEEDGASGLTFSVVSNDKPAYFQTIGITQANLSFSLAPNAFGVAKVAVRATDSGGLSVQDVLTITINGVNDPPSFNPIQDIQIYENASQQSVTMTNISSGPLESQSMSIAASSGNTALIPQPTVTYNGTGSTATLSFKPTVNQTGIAIITVKVTDTGLAEFTRTFTVEVLNINDPPTLNPITVAPILEDSDLIAIPLTGITAGPQESQVLTLTATPANATLFEVFEVVYQSPQNVGSIRVKPKSNANGSVLITAKVTDDGSNVAPNVNSITRTFTLTITPVNDPPVITSTPMLIAIVGEVYQYEITASDVDDGDVLTTTVTQKPAWLTLTSQGAGKWLLKGTPPANAGGDSILKLQVKDVGGLSTLQDYTLIVDTRPGVSNTQVVMHEDEIHNLPSSFFSNLFSDADNDGLTKIQITSLPKNGNLFLRNSNVAVDTEIEQSSLSELKYTPDTDFSGKDTLSWKGFDGLAYSTSSAKIMYTINPVNDPPEITSLEQTILEVKAGEGPTLISNLFEAIDVDNDSLEGAEIGFRRVGFVPEMDILIFENTPLITGSFGSQSGILTLSGKAPISEYVAAIRNIKYDNISTVFSYEEVEKAVYYTISDGKTLSGTKDLAIKLIDRTEDIEIPNGFTPNNDTDNDTWEIPGIERHKNAEVRVFTRLGQLVFESVGDYKDWDGTKDGSALPSDTYYYTIDLNLVNRKQVYKGSVMILK